VRASINYFIYELDWLLVI